MGRVRGVLAGAARCGFVISYPLTSDSSLPLVKRVCSLMPRSLTSSTDSVELVGEGVDEGLGKEPNDGPNDTSHARKGRALTGRDMERLHGDQDLPAQQDDQEDKPAHQVAGQGGLTAEEGKGVGGCVRNEACHSKKGGGAGGVGGVPLPPRQATWSCCAAGTRRPTDPRTAAATPCVAEKKSRVVWFTRLSTRGQAWCTQCHVRTWQAAMMVGWWVTTTTAAGHGRARGGQCCRAPGCGRPAGGAGAGTASPALEEAPT